MRRSRPRCARRMRTRAVSFLVAGLAVALPLALGDVASPLEPQRAESATLRFSVREKGRGDAPLPCRVHLTGPDGKPVRAPDLPFFRDHFSTRGDTSLEVLPGTYRYTVARGLEYRDVPGEVTLEAGDSRTVPILLERWIDLAARGWWSGETHVHRPLEDVPLLLESEDLHAAPVLTQWNDRDLWADRELPRELVVPIGDDRAYHVLGCEDERQGGAIFFLDLSRPLAIGGAGREHPSPLSFLGAAREQPGVRVEVEKPFWWDAPTWVATGHVDAIGLANNHMCREGMYENEAWGRPRDTERLPPPRGNGFYTQELYYRILDCGFRIPPTAGSASGVLPNPVGYNRVYVHLDEPFSYEAWRRGLDQGRSFVTNGPVLLVEANGALPGEVFRLRPRETRRLALDIRVDSLDPLEAVEVVRDGRVVKRFEGDEIRPWLRWDGLEYSKAGWFLVRAIARVPSTFRFASTAPFWVDVEGAPPRVHREDVEFFIEWISERIAAIESGQFEKLEGAELEAVLGPHRRALEVFRARLEGAVAE